MRNYKVFMPPGKRVYNVYMPAGERDYKAALPDPITCQEGGPNLVTNPTDFTAWFGGTGVTVTGDALLSPGNTLADQVEFATTTTQLYTQMFGLNAGSVLDVTRGFWLKVISTTNSPIMEFEHFGDDFRGRWEITLDHPSLADGNWHRITDSHPAVFFDSVWTVLNDGSLSPAFAMTSAAMSATVGLWCVDMRYF